MSDDTSKQEAMDMADLPPLDTIGQATWRSLTTGLTAGGGIFAFLTLLMVGLYAYRKCACVRKCMVNTICSRKPKQSPAANIIITQTPLPTPETTPPCFRRHYVIDQEEPMDQTDRAASLPRSRRPTQHLQMHKAMSQPGLHYHITPSNRTQWQPFGRAQSFHAPTAPNSQRTSVQGDTYSRGTDVTTDITENTPDYCPTCAPDEQHM